MTINRVGVGVGAGCMYISPDSVIAVASGMKKEIPPTQALLLIIVGRFFLHLLLPAGPFRKPWRDSRVCCLASPFFGLSCLSASALLEGQEDQSILISGVSGAGKTETAKLLLGHLASVAGSEEGGVGSERIQHMVECTVVLESFGNAVMVRERDAATDSSRLKATASLGFRLETCTFGLVGLLCFT